MTPKQETFLRILMPILFIAIIIVAFIGLHHLPMPRDYDYHHFEGVLIRTDKQTGAVDIAGPNGWRKAGK